MLRAVRQPVVFDSFLLWDLLVLVVTEELSPDNGVEATETSDGCAGSQHSAGGPANDGGCDGQAGRCGACCGTAAWHRTCNRRQV